MKIRNEPSALKSMAFHQKNNLDSILYQQKDNKLNSEKNSSKINNKNKNIHKSSSANKKNDYYKKNAETEQNNPQVSSENLAKLLENRYLNVIQNLIPTCETLKLGDRVNIDLDFEMVQSLQVGHGDWCEAMFEALGTTGQITAIDKDFDFEVTYPSGNKWIFNPAVLTKARDSKEEFNKIIKNDFKTLGGSTNQTYTINSLVQITDDLEKLQAFQLGHGGWTDEMFTTMGKVGRIVKIYPDNDLKIEIEGKTWTFNMFAVSKFENSEFIRNATLRLSRPRIISSENLIKPVVLNGELIIAAAEGNLEKCKEILKRPNCNVNSLYLGQTALHAAARNGCVKVVKLLIEFDANLEIQDNDGDRAIHHAAYGNEYDVIEILSSGQVKSDINAVNYRRQTALHIAINKAHIEVARLLIELGADTNLQDADGDTPLHDAISKRSEEIVDMLLKTNIDFLLYNKNGFNPIQLGSLCGADEIVEKIIEKLKEEENLWQVNEKKEDGFTALHLACLNNHLKCTQLLIENGHSYVNAKNAYDQTPLHLGIERQNYQIIKFLIEKGGNVLAQDRDGDSCMHLLLRNYSSKFFKNYCLVKEMSLINLNEEGEFFKYSLEKQRLIEIVFLLIDKGADLMSRNKKNQNPTDISIDPKFNQIIINYFQRINSNKEFKLCELNSKLNMDPIANECMICYTVNEYSLLKLCEHFKICNSCSLIIKNCSICQTIS